MIEKYIVMLMLLIIGSGIIILSLTMIFLIFGCMAGKTEETHHMIEEFFKKLSLPFQRIASRLWDLLFNMKSKLPKELRREEDNPNKVNWKAVREAEERLDRWN